jgi:heptosyltransferase II
MSRKIAIIKIGATGDVVRTTVLLHLFANDEIIWITAKHNIAILPLKQANLKKIIAIDDVENSGVLKDEFDFVISLDDDFKCATLASSFKTKDLFGAYIKDGKVVYTSDSNEWFDMGLSSRFGKTRADELKWKNKDSFQEILFRMLGAKFNGETYLIPEDIISQGKPNVIGIEDRAGARWPTKMWNKFPELAEHLRKDGYEVVFFKEREHIKEYLQDIGNTSLIISGDTLGMHIALALKIPIVTLFTCTSAVEIYGYNNMEKIVSAELKRAFYKTEYIPEAVDCISLTDVLKAVNRFKKVSM